MYMKVGEGRRENNGIEGMGKGGGRKWRDEGDQQEGSGGKRSIYYENVTMKSNNLYATYKH